MEKDIGLAIVSAANKTIKYQNKNPRATIEEVIGHAMEAGGEPGEARLVALATASAVFHFKEKNIRAKDKEVLQFVLNKIPEIIKNIEVEI